MAKSGSAAHSVVTTELRPRRGWVHVDWREFWRYRQLLVFLTWRDILVRYKQAVLGVSWAILQPVMTMIVFTLVFGRLVGISTGDTPYAVFSYAGLLPWQLFAASISRSGASVVQNANLLTKVYFPRMIMPMSAIFAALLDFLITVIVLFIIMALYSVEFTANLLWLPLLAVACMVTALSVSLWLSAMNVVYRDVQHVMPLLVQLWMFLSPVIYPSDTVPSGVWSVVYSLNPMVGVIQAFRWAILGENLPPASALMSVGVVFVLLVGGLVYFSRMERTFADLV